MNRRKIACYQTENIGFKIGLIAKENAILCTGSSSKQSEFFCVDENLNDGRDIDNQMVTENTSI